MSCESLDEVKPRWLNCVTFQFMGTHTVPSQKDFQFHSVKMNGRMLHTLQTCFSCILGSSRWQVFDKHHSPAPTQVLKQHQSPPRVRHLSAVIFFKGSQSGKQPTSFLPGVMLQQVPEGRHCGAHHTPRWLLTVVLEYESCLRCGDARLTAREAWSDVAVSKSDWATSFRLLYSCSCAMWLYIKDPVPFCPVAFLQILLLHIIWFSPQFSRYTWRILFWLLNSKVKLNKGALACEAGTCVLDSSHALCLTCEPFHV